MNRATPNLELSPCRRRSTVVWGLALCLLAAMGYSVVNVCLRQLTIDCDRMLIIVVKELVAVVIVGPWLAWHALRGRRRLPSGRVLLALALAGLMTQLCGNLPNLWALSVIGLAVAMPLMSGTNLVATAVLGRVFLGERVSRSTTLAIGLLLISVVLLGLAAPRASRAIHGEAAATATIDAGEQISGKSAADAKAATWGLAVLATGTTCMAGIVYAVLVVVIRRNVTSETPATVVVFMITGMGVASLGPWLAAERGLGWLADVRSSDLGLMVLAGVLNLFSFLALTKGLQWTPVARANMMMMSQVVLGTVAGVALFAEPASLWLGLGACLTIAGMILIGREVRTEPETPETPL